MWRHWDDWRAGKRQHLFVVTLADGSARDLTPVDHDVPTIATSGDGDVSVAPDGREIAVAMHGDSTVADNTNVDIYLIPRDGGPMRQFTTATGADNTPRYSPDGKWLAYLSMERAGFEADRLRLMLVGRSDGRRQGGPSRSVRTRGAPTPSASMRSLRSAAGTTSIVSTFRRSVAPSP